MGNYPLTSRNRSGKAWKVSKGKALRYLGELKLWPYDCSVFGGIGVIPTGDLTTKAKHLALAKKAAKKK